MKLHYMGKYDKNPESLPSKPHKPNCVAFKEPKDSKKLNIVLNLVALPIIAVFGLPILLHDDPNGYLLITIGTVLYFLSLFPHELLHAICFKEDVYLYTNFKQGSLFVVGTEDMSKSRFIFLSLLPNIILGFIPYVIFLIFPDMIILGTFGTMNIASGCGDYMNVFNAIVQMPKGSRTYLHKFNSYWYIPEENEQKADKQ